MCLHSFCWNCTEEVHRSVDCDTRAKWIRKNSDESENMNWIIANLKPCPKCKRNIEKNKGCNHMTCGPPCLHQFCWICIGSWQNHNSSFWGNGYEEGVYKDETTMRRERAKESLDRYTHYFERWEANLTSTKKAATNLHQMRTTKIKEISEKFLKLEIELEYLVEAWVQIVECRQVLTWTYAYGYYLPADEPTKKELFEFLQRQAEAALERLHKCAEEEVQANLMEKISATDIVGYADFQRKLVHLTSVTRNHFEKLVTTLQNDLSDVSSSSKKRKRDEVGIWSQSEDKLNGWACDQCTYFNDMSATRCAMCYGPLLLEEDEE
ncbi:hypothetical protein RJ640_004142 [Escallonia rubra]|uniref:RBR-type E3 ubiquitin transferase n=1 Tax=Escallonia rubra TaxID=112253 RepID=A0AA88RQ49_9ASTE|nr:hypothetical protein RJ640_004142 [Escallonia rubra]